VELVISMTENLEFGKISCRLVIKFAQKTTGMF
jgi:hypothetical protein